MFTDVSGSIYVKEVMRKKQSARPENVGSMFLRKVGEFLLTRRNVQSVPGGNVRIPGGHSIGHSKQKCVYVSYPEFFPR
jgi:hypothetical protein